jgi:hypothetical protein
MFTSHATTSSLQRYASPIVTITLLIVALCSLPSVLAADSAPTTQPAVSDADFDAALERAVALVGPELQRDLVPIASRFQTIDVSTSAGQNQWQFRTLNQRGKGFDAMRFKVPSGAATHFYWAFSISQAAVWYIEPLKGEHKFLFKQFFQPNPAHYKLPPGIHQDLILQQIPDRLEPGCEYVLWFKFDHTKPVTFAGSLVLLNNDDIDSVESIEAAIGLNNPAKTN